MSDQFVAEIRIFPFNFPPTGWAFCNGQLMPISQNTALFALLGTYYGGDGKSTFALAQHAEQRADADRPGPGAEPALPRRDVGRGKRSPCSSRRFRSTPTSLSASDADADHRPRPAGQAPGQGVSGTPGTDRPA